MRIKAPGIERLDTGGASSFLANLNNSFKSIGGAQLVQEGDYDVLFIAGASLANHSDVERAKAENKPIVLRVDNILEDSRNRNSGMSRLRAFADSANVVVYQSEWAKRLLEPYCGKGVVIYNGVDTHIFYPKETGNTGSPRGVRVLYSKYSRNEIKQYHEVIYWWRDYNLDNKDGTLVLVGKYAEDKIRIDHPFEFHNGEKWEHKGIITDRNQLANIIRSCDLAFLPYMFDACSNTILEVQACGVPVIYSPTGGTPEIVELGVPVDWNLKASEMADQALAYKRCFDIKEFQEKWGLDVMGKKYKGVFNLVLDQPHEI